MSNNSRNAKSFITILITSGDVDEVAFGEEPFFLDAEVSGFGTYAVIPANSHARMSGPLK